jgi:ABC-type nitrate/sulfonate/bicarbonate transport system ATPase subunit
MNAYTKQERLLTIEGLNLFYGPKQVLRDINLHIDNIVRPGMLQGQCVALLGPSGVGKTQLFRCIAGLNNATSGSIRLEKAVQIGVVQQAYPLLNHRTVWSNLMLASQTGAHEDPVKYAEELLTHFGIPDKRNAYPLELSGGQRQRVAIIQQLMANDGFLLMDEPFSGLDVSSKSRVIDTIKKVTTTHDHNTVIFTTHDLESAVRLADEVWVLGREEGKPGATVVERVDLISRGLAWNDNVDDHPNFFPTVKHLHDLMHRI